MEYHFEIFEEEDGGFWAESVELKGCLSDGKTLTELKSRLEDALNLYLNEPPGSSQVFPLPDKKLDSEEKYIRIPVKPNIAFALLVRHYRLSRNLTLEQAQKTIGLKNRNSYVRLETPGNPTIESISLVKKAFPEINLNDCFY